MRTIQKGEEPGCLAQARRDASAGGAAMSGEDWPDLLPPGCIDDIRGGLTAEQHGLCAYCGSRITPSRPSDANPSGTRVEHWEPRSRQPELTFTWSSLLGVCQGRSVTGREVDEHCDTARGNAALHICPSRTPNLTQRFGYSKVTGEMRPSAQEDDEASEDIETLRLNTPRLMANRLEVIQHVQRKLREDDSSGGLQRLIRRYTARPGRPLPPCAFVAQQYLARKVRAHG